MIIAHVKTTHQYKHCLLFWSNYQERFEMISDRKREEGHHRIWYCVGRSYESMVLCGRSYEGEEGYHMIWYCVEGHMKVRRVITWYDIVWKVIWKWWGSSQDMILCVEGHMKVRKVITGYDIMCGRSYESDEGHHMIWYCGEGYMKVRRVITGYNILCGRSYQSETVIWKWGGSSQDMILCGLLSCDTNDNDIDNILYFTSPICKTFCLCLCIPLHSCWLLGMPLDYVLFNSLKFVFRGSVGVGKIIWK